MRVLSLKAKLSWLIGIVLLTILLLNIAILVNHAGPRVRAEANSIDILAHELVGTSLASLQESKDPLPSLHHLFEDLRNSRHLEIEILPSDDPTPLATARVRSEREKGIPDWFVSFVAPAPKVTIIPAKINAVQYGYIAIASNPVDEVAEVWSDIESLAATSFVATLVILIGVLVLVRFSLRPFDALARGLAELEAGRSHVRLELKGAAEFRNISSRLNSLATTLERVRNEKLALMEQLIKVQDDERRQIARDLHDEAGPCLFSIRAGAATLMNAVAAPEGDRTCLRKTCEELNAAGKALQDLIRRMLDQLRPPELAELGLGAALQGLIANWQGARPNLILTLETPRDLSSVGEAVGLTAYRVIQESLTNIFRHASASQARVRLAFENTPEPETSDRDLGHSVLHIIIEDDGIGMPQQRGRGSGLLGMSERVQALEGSFLVQDRQGSGTRIEVILPLPEQEENES
ncbi:histidine kinase [Methylocapsa sp. D3K7]|uniref:histidine kinase n=1 Tax=Methylocapsa sp. D3K7 TaxID=3041435 RepID=UPI00244E9C76|nr:histidine kinase [Methylocapsa sp. D3K7]WGJ16199.1 histidine kinase [Methylocapsa sp. D3K7]